MRMLVAEIWLKIRRLVFRTDDRSVIRAE